MDYKSILTVLTGGKVEGSALDGAVALAQARGAHLDVVSLGLDTSTPGVYYAGANAMIEHQALERARAEAASGEVAANDTLEGQSVRCTVLTAVAQFGSVLNVVGDLARYCDLVVLPRPYGDGRTSTDEAILEAALFAGRGSVLVLPGTSRLERPASVVVAWNQSAEALAAIRAALPLISSAQNVHIAIVDPPRHSADRSDPGGALSQMLARHGARTEVSVLAATMPRVADVLTRHCRDQGADLLVMGAYGHSRFREALIGGATRDVLESAEIPVFMHH